MKGSRTIIAVSLTPTTHSVDERQVGPPSQRRCFLGRTSRIVHASSMDLPSSKCWARLCSIFLLLPLLVYDVCYPWMVLGRFLSDSLPEVKESTRRNKHQVMGKFASITRITRRLICLRLIYPGQILRWIPGHFENEFLHFFFLFFSRFFSAGAFLVRKMARNRGTNK